MPDSREVLASLYGAWRLIRFDASGMTWFNLSFEGFWRSFFAAVPVAPFFALLVFLDLSERAEPVDFGWATIVSTVAYGIGWVAFPIVAIFITKLLALTQGYVPLIVAYNWVSVPQIVIQAIVAVIGASGLAPAGLAGLLLFAVVVYILLFEWFVVHTALQTTPITAAGIVLLQETIGILINYVAYNLV